MCSLIFSIFRSKIKLFLTLILYIFIFGGMLVIFNNYEINLNKINELKKTEKYTIINLIIEDGQMKKEIEKIDHILSIDERQLDDKNLFLLIKIDDDKNVNYVENKLDDLGFNYSEDKIITPELEMYLEADNFNKVFVTVIIICLFVLLLIELRLQFVWENNNILFLKILGYSNYLILFIMMLRLFIPIILSIIISSLLFLIFIFISHCSLNAIILLIPILFLILICLFLLPWYLIKINKIKFSNIDF